MVVNSCLNTFRVRISAIMETQTNMETQGSWGKLNLPLRITLIYLMHLPTLGREEWCSCLSTLALVLPASFLFPQSSAAGLELTSSPSSSNVDITYVRCGGLALNLLTCLLCYCRILLLNFRSSILSRSFFCLLAQILICNKSQSVECLGHTRVLPLKAWSTQQRPQLQQSLSGV